ncbi:MAG: ATP-binding protein [Pirellulales bacterium]
MLRNSKVIGSLIAIVLTCAMLAARLALEGALAEQARLMPFVLAVIAAAWWGGLWPGLLATGLGLVLGILFIVPPDAGLQIVTLADGLNAVIFVIVGVTVSALFEALHTAQRRDTEKQFRDLADSMPQMAWMARPDGYRFWFNRRWQHYTAATSADLQGNGWQAFCDPKERMRVAASWAAALSEGRPWEATYPIRRADGEFRWHLARAVPVKNTAGEIVRWFGTSTDIQDRMAAEQALREADVRKDHFLATLAHELRNPLAPISNALQLWPHVSHEPQEMEQLRLVIDRQMRQLVRLIDDLLDLSRINEGKIALQRQPLELGGVLAGALESVRPLITAANHQVRMRLSSGPVWVDGDAARLIQVFANILTNAAKFTPRGGRIEIEVERQGERSQVVIRDNGPGIPADMLRTIFDAFRQVDDTVGRSQGGLGIGLWLVKQLVELHGGTVEARSKGPGEGSEFVVQLPTVNPPATTIGEPRRDAPAGESACPRRRILVVDDLRASADTLVKVLECLGQEAFQAYDGPSAIKAAHALHPDLILLDIAMPALDGYEVARRLRASPDLEGTTLVALTGYGQPDDKRQAAAAGFDLHLTKPADLRSLRELLAAGPARRRSAGPLVSS